ncbi:ATP-binding protein [Streptomyces sp. LARHCF252]
MTPLTCETPPDIAQPELGWLLAATTTCPAVARRQVAEQLHAWNLKPLISDVVLIVSELVTNAISHGCRPTRHSLRLISRPDRTKRLRVEVGDRGGGWDGLAPCSPVPDGDRCHGRGLHLVDALAAEWGRQVVNGGHIVWAEIDIPVGM